MRLRACADLLRINLGDDDPFVLAAVGQNFAPRIDNERVAVAFAAAVQRAVLAWRDDIGAVLDRAGAREHMPVRASGQAREGGGHREHCRATLRERAIEEREAQIVADQRPSPPQGVSATTAAEPGATISDSR